MLRGTGAALTACLLMGGVTATAHADPQVVTDARAQVLDLQRQSAAAAERVNGAKAQLARSQERLTIFSRQVTAGRIDLARQQLALEAMARQLYVDGGGAGAAMSFTFEDPDQFLADLDRFAATSSNQSEVVSKARAQAISLKSTSAALDREQQRLAQATADLGAAQAAAQAKVAQATALLAALEEQERQRILAEARAAAERARAEAALLLAARAEAQRVAALEAQAQAAAAAAQRTADAQNAAAAASPGVAATATPAAAADGRPVAPLTSPPANRAEAVRLAVDFALTKVGGPYVWGASGPDAYDCSGLTQAAWAKAGVALTHYSGTQYTQTAPVPLADIQPGDLLFFYSIHQHVGIYIGDGRFVHAANSIDGIRLDSLPGYYRDNLVAASRPLA
ncbi:MAG: peptidoglycan DL-endopeptidase CwlO [Actinomycetota bacterium]|nr:peptidoglycan DL-endopeptidase CwlO [Actinomycetota bacterium]